MNREAARDQIRASLQGYLEGKGVDTSRAFTCLNPAHEDKHPSMHYNRTRNTIHCFACGASYDTIDLIKQDYNLASTKEAFDKAYDLFRIDIDGPKQPSPKKSETDYLTQCAARLTQTNYLKNRGISHKTAQKMGLGYDPEFATKDESGYVKWQAVTIPTGENSYVIRNTQSAGKDDRIRKRGITRMLGIETLKTAKTPIFIVEGEFDALSIIEAGGEAVALGSVANVNKLITALESAPPAQPLILSLDNDESGEAASYALWEALNEKSIPCEPYNIAGNHNDPNEALVSDRAGFIEAVRDAEKSILSRATERRRDILDSRRASYIAGNNVYSHLQAFLAEIDRVARVPLIETGFAALDAALDGGLYEGLYILGAVSSLGKTSFCLQIADQIAEKGADVLIFSLEMARSELMAKSISRMTYLLSNDPHAPKTARGILDGRRRESYTTLERKLIADAIGAYGIIAERLFIIEGVGNIGAKHIRDAVKNHVELTGNVPVVLVDYLQLLAPDELRATDKQNTDRSVLELKRISRDYKLPLIAISSFNRENYRQSVNMASFKESGAIEYSSDVLIGLQAKGAGEDGFDAEEARRLDPREVELVILKNRNGKAGEKIAYDYRPMFNCFYEVVQPKGKRRV